MMKFRIIVSPEHEERALEALVKVGAIHIAEPEEAEAKAIPRELRLIAERKLSIEDLGIDKVIVLMEAIGGEMREYIERAREIHHKVLRIRELQRCLQALADMKIKLDMIGRHEYTFVYAGTVDKEFASELKSMLRKNNIAYWSRTLDDKVLLVVSGVPQQEEKVKALLGQYGFRLLRLPEGLDPDPIKAKKMLETNERRLYEELANIASEMITKIKESEEREWMRRASLLERFLEISKEFHQLATSVENLLEREKLEVPEPLKRALERKIVAEIISVDKLQGLIEQLSSILDSLRSEYREISAELSTLHSLEASMKELSPEMRKPIEEQLSKARERLLELADKLSSSYAEVCRYEPFVAAMRYMKGTVYKLRIFRRHYVSIIEGWIPSEYAKTLEATIKESVPRIIDFIIARPSREDRVPVRMEYKGPMKYLLALTLGRDIPSYWEINPTPFFTVLFILMYGLMFGDMGLGPVLALLGLLCYRSAKPFLGISPEGVKTLGVLMSLCGISTTAFGVLYGVAFLKEIMKPLLLSPIHDIFGIIRVALIFGIIQLILSMVLNIVNGVIRRDIYEIFLSGRGLAGLLYYIAGINIAIVLLKTNFNWGALLEGDNVMFVAVALAMMVTVMLGPLYRHFEEHEPIGACLMEGLVEFLELLVAYPANSLSYIRLAAFAIAHEAFGLLAEALAGMIGLIPSYLFSNILVLGIEGFAVGIQALRLVYYEFSTKFLKGGGILYRPLKSEILSA